MLHRKEYFYFSTFFLVTYINIYLHFTIHERRIFNIVFISEIIRLK